MTELKKVLAEHTCHWEGEHVSPLYLKQGPVLVGEDECPACAQQRLTEAIIKGEIPLYELREHFGLEGKGVR